MKNKTTIVFQAVLVGAIFHLIRDILQIMEVKNIFTEIGHWDHQWCNPYCDYVTLPIDAFLIIGSLVIIRRQKSGVLGIIMVTALTIGLLMWLLK